MKQVSSFEGELFKTRFPLIGSIYDDSQTGFRVGRLGPSVVKGHNLGNDRGPRGPWKSIRAYLRWYVTAEQTWLAECTEDYKVLRRRICHDEDPNAHISYFKSLCDILGQIIDNARFLDKVDPSIAHFVLFHEDIRTNNIVVAYEDPTRVVGIVDWEGARVLPMCSCFEESQVAEPESTTSEQYLPLRELRREIMFDMEPGLSQVDNEVGLALQRLHDLVSYPLSARHSYCQTSWVMLSEASRRGCIHGISRVSCCAEVITNFIHGFEINLSLGEIYYYLFYRWQPFFGLFLAPHRSFSGFSAGFRSPPSIFSP